MASPGTRVESTAAAVTRGHAGGDRPFSAFAPFPTRQPAKEAL